MPKNVDHNRYSIAAEPNRQPVPPQGQQGPPGQGQDAFSAFYAARDLSYEELTARRQMQVEMMRKEAEHTETLMTDAMRQANLDVLISVINCELTGTTGMNPEQALVILHETLSRPEYDNIKPFYPGLTEAVEARYAEIEKHRLPGRKKV